MTRDTLLHGKAIFVLVVGLSACAQAQVIYSWPGANPWLYTVPPVSGLRSYSIPTPGLDFYVFGYGVPPAYVPGVPYGYPYSPYAVQPYGYGYGPPYYLAPFPYGYQPARPYPYVRPYRFRRPRPPDDDTRASQRDDNRQPQEPMTTLQGNRPIRRAPQ